MKLEKTISILILLVCFAASAYLYPILPEKVATHWDIDGVANGYSNKDFAAFFLPIISTIIFVFMLLLPQLDPLKKNIMSFYKEYLLMVLGIVFFMSYIHIWLLIWAIGFMFNMGQVLAPAFAILFFILSKVLSKAKRNWFVGIRTPWTLSSEKVWNKTHALAAKLFKAVAVISLFGIILPKLAFLAVIGSALASAIVLVVYSYVIYKKGK